MVYKIIGKRGGIHVDWAISMGLFLVYVILLFIVIKPGSYPIHKPESLFTIVENTFLSNTQINIKDVQFSVTHCIEGREVKLDDRNNNYKFSEIKKIDTSTSTILTKEGEQATNGVNVGGSATIYCTNAGGYTPWIDDAPKKFLAISYQKELKKDNDPASLPKYEIECVTKSATAPKASPGKECKAKLGAVTEYIGFYKEYIDEIETKSNNFEQLKKDWGFPLDSNFKITVVRKETEAEDDIKIFDRLNPEAPEGVSVFIKEFDAVLLNKYNEREKIRITIIIW
ncbi:MAG: hypothetical protein AABW58_03815 [Nanoarchaeota archaeon]